MNIKENTILITGGTSGIGLAFAEAFIAEGNKVIITGRRADRLDTIKARLPGIITKVSDVADASQRVELAAWIAEHHPDTNVLMNNAGVQFITDFRSGIDADKVRTEIETNLMAPAHLASLFVPHLSGKTDAAIINITSGLAFVPIAFMAMYCATKAAMHSLTISLRYQLKETGISVIEIAPPSVDTELGHDRREDKTQSHGGIPVQEFIDGAMAALKNNELEATIGQSAGLRAKGEQLFEQINGGFIF